MDYHIQGSLVARRAWILGNAIHSQGRAGLPSCKRRGRFQSRHDVAFSQAGSLTGAKE